jgi:hypothetical protein
VAAAGLQVLQPGRRVGRRGLGVGARHPGVPSAKLHTVPKLLSPSGYRGAHACLQLAAGDTELSVMEVAQQPGCSLTSTG